MIEMPFQPDYAVHPGEVLEQFMEDLDLSVDQVADLMSIAVSDVKLFLGGGAQVTDHLARKLELATGFPLQCWLNLESQYQDDLIRLLPMD